MSDDRRLDAELGKVLFDLKVWSDYDECSQWTPGARWSYGSECYEIECWFAVPKNLTPEEVDDLDLGDPKYQLEHYSSTWDGLGLVVEAMRGKGYAFRLTTKSEQFMWAYFGPLRGIGKEGFAGDSYAPRAVALAAYQALTGRKWEG
jgi:hypothetical protein